MAKKVSAKSETKASKKEEAKPVIQIIVGTRPNVIKAVPLVMNNKLKHNYVLLNMRQHRAKEMMDEIISEFNIPKNKVITVNESISDDEANKMMRDERIAYFIKLLSQNKKNMLDCKATIVPGDCDCDLAGALFASMNGMKLIHLEAGMRTSENIPEEVNRKVIDHLSDLNLCIDEEAQNTCVFEGIDNSEVVGNIHSDTLGMALGQSEEEAGKKFQVLITLHRNNNVDSYPFLSDLLGAISSAFSSSSIRPNLVFVVHPRITHMHGTKLQEEFGKKFSFIQPKPFLEFANMMKESLMVITDSGGVQTETTFLNTPCITFREDTEHTGTLCEQGGTNKVIRPRSFSIQEFIREIQLSFKKVVLGQWPTSKKLKRMGVASEVDEAIFRFI